MVPVACLRVERSLTHGWVSVLLSCLLLPCLSITAAAQPDRSIPAFPDVDLRPTVRPTALHDIKQGGVKIVGTARQGDRVLVRVTTGQGTTCQAHCEIKAGNFQCVYPNDFRNAPRLTPSVLFIDATTRTDFDGKRNEGQQGEVTIVVYDSRRHLIPDYPSAFTTDLLDRKGRRDTRSSEWNATRALVNLYMQSRGAHLAGAGQTGFDLAKPGDRTTFQKNFALYDFDHRERDWSQPFGNRVRRTFWQSVWDNWFNASNNHPLDGNPANPSPSNYLPYAFTNDFADILIQHWMRRKLTGSVEDNLDTMCREATENLLACQHRAPTNFALKDAKGRQENYTAGAFRYGLFVNGDFLVEGKGWFTNPDFRDYADGGVLNGRAVWAVGEALKAEPKGPLAPKLKSALQNALQFCLKDALAHGYAKRTQRGYIYWRDAGEHAYLVVGMVAACTAAPDLTVFPGSEKPMPLREVCASALNALVDLMKPHYQWAVYPNVDSMAIVALADGALALRNHSDAAKWRKAAESAAQVWMNAKVDPAEFKGAPVHFGLRLSPDTMTYRWSKLAPDAWQPHNYLFFYQTGHWIHALSRLYALTDNAAYRLRAEAMIAYFCGDNPWGTRLLNELGGVYNWVEDRDNDGIEDHLKQDMYPESTAFTQIGLFHLLHTLAHTKS